MPFSDWVTNLIPQADRDNFAYVTRADFRFQMKFSGDDNFGSTDSRGGIRIIYAVDNPLDYPLTLVDDQVHGTFSGSDTFTIPDGRVITGFEYRIFTRVGDDDDLGGLRVDFEWKVHSARVTSSSNALPLELRSDGTGTQVENSQGEQNMSVGTFRGPTLTVSVPTSSSYLVGGKFDINFDNRGDDNNVGGRAFLVGSMSNIYKNGVIVAEDETKIIHQYLSNELRLREQ